MMTSAVTSPDVNQTVDMQQVQDALLTLPELEVDTAKFPCDRYKPVSIMGHGATGIVYLCVDKLLSKRVAIKTLHTVDAAQLVAFQLEAKTTSRLNHDNIIKVLDFGATEGGVPFMVMELVDGVSLEAAIQSEGPLEPAVAASLVRKICIGLEHAHKNGILHRDVKSSNTLLSHTDSGVEPVVIDFGVAALKFARQEPTIISGKTIVGSPFYMAPDQALGRPYDERSEIYSIGCMLFETLTGRTPFEGATTLETIGMHAHMPPPTLHDIAPEREFGPQLEELVARCLAKDPADRYRDCAELADALEQLIPMLLAIGEEEHTDEEELDATTTEENKSHPS
jgi:Serine/threonine protein kinase